MHVKDSYGKEPRFESPFYLLFAKKERRKSTDFLGPKNFHFVFNPLLVDAPPIHIVSTGSLYSIGSFSKKKKKKTSFL